MDKIKLKKLENRLDALRGGNQDVIVRFSDGTEARMPDCEAILTLIDATGKEVVDIHPADGYDRGLGGKMPELLGGLVGTV